MLNILAAQLAPKTVLPPVDVEYLVVAGGGGAAGSAAGGVAAGGGGAGGMKTGTLTALA